MNAPACPKCGCPPRNMTTLRRVSVDIGVTRDGVVLEHGDYRVGKIAEETAEETGRYVRRLRTLPHPNFAAGFRSEVPENLPEYIEEPTYEKLLAVIRGGEGK